MIMLGAIAIAVILLAPKGIMGTLQERLGFRILSPHRRIVIEHDCRVRYDARHGFN